MSVEMQSESNREVARARRRALARRLGAAAAGIAAVALIAGAVGMAAHAAPVAW